MTFLRRVGAAAVVALALPSSAVAAGELTIVSSARVEAPKGFYTGQPLRFTYTVRNQTAAAVLAEYLSVPVRSSADPATAIDTLCANAKDVTVAPGGTFDCVAPRDEGYPTAASYTYWADWRAPGDVWHHGELGPDQAFSLAAPPQTTLSTAAQVSVGEQMLGGARDTTITIKNEGAAIGLIDRNPAFGGLHPGDFALAGDTCTQGQLAPGASCDLVVRFTPQVPGVRAATLAFKANTSSPTTVVNLSGAGVAQPVPVIVTSPDRLSVTLSYGYSRISRMSTRFTALSVKGVPKGATVKVTCSKGCSRRTLTVKRSGTISLKGFVKRSVRVKTKIAVRVTRPGSLGVVKTLTVRAGKRPSIATTCLNLDGKRESCSR